MASNSFGNIFRITTFGESHGPALGVVIDGCTAGINFAIDDLLSELARRKPGQSDITTARKEDDAPEILSGVFEGKTTGMPIAVIVRNEGQRSEDYEKLKKKFRPGHADETYDSKYAIRDHRGGGRSSGRETVTRVIAGVVARKLLPQEMKITGKMISPTEDYIRECKEKDDSTGGMIEIRIQKPPKNLGDPVFSKLKQNLTSGLMSIGAVTGVSYGAGFDAAKMKGSEYIADRSNFGGILGGISTGEDIVLHMSIKPTTSIGTIAKEGRHDPCIVPRVIPVAEAMVALVLADAYLMNKAQKF